MDDFLDWIKRRKAELRRELTELEVAEKIYRDSGFPTSMGQSSLDFYAAQSSSRPKTIKGMILSILEEAMPRGLTALEILDFINARWMPNLERTSLSPQLTRLKRDSKILNEKGLWKLALEQKREEQNDADT